MSQNQFIVSAVHFPFKGYTTVRVHNLAEVNDALDKGLHVECIEKLLGDPAGTACHLLVRLGKPKQPQDVKQKLLVLTVWLHENAEPQDNLGELLKLTHGAENWTVAGTEHLLASPAHGTAAVLYRLQKPK